VRLGIFNEHCFGRRNFRSLNLEVFKEINITREEIYIPKGRILNENENQKEKDKREDENKERN
jgi:sRNA-binding carbon storage regulator CsrA